MKLRKYKKLLNKSRHGWIWYPWIRAQDIDGRRVAYLEEGSMGSSWGFRVLCTSLVTYPPTPSKQLRNSETSITGILDNDSA